MSSTIIEPQRQSNPNHNPLKSVVKFFAGVAQVSGGTVLTIGTIVSTLAAGSMVGLAISFRNLPDVRTLQGYIPTETSYIYDIKGRMLATIHGEAHREVIELEQVSPELKRAVLAIEDSHFYQHHGINFYSVGRAVVANFKKGEVSEGASTLTMQLAKNLFLSRDRTVQRKLAEAVLAIRLEQIFTKEEILELYFNTIYWGHNNYGAQTAAESYFNKNASQLNLAEASMMAGLIQAPEQYSPFNNYEETKKRQKQVLNRMRDIGWISEKEAKAAYETPLLIGKPTSWQTSQLPYITDAVIAELKERFTPESVSKGGMRIQTTVDYDFQKWAEKNVQESYNYYLNYGWLRTSQIALAAVDPRTHFVKALVGGVDYEKSQFNRAVQSRRQPGSTFKPFVYYTAFATGKYTPDSVVNDTPVRYRDGNIDYRPQNYGGGYSGPMSIRAALIQSSNVPAVKIGVAVGLDKVIDTVRSLGIKNPMQPVLSLPLGSVGLSPLEMAGAFATFAADGWHSDVTTIVRVTDSRGNILLDNTKPPKLVLDQWSVASLTSVLQGVINGGTGQRAYIGRPAAGKTGTTSAEKDVWFVGYTPQLATAVWIGKDNYQSLGRGVTGGGLAAPVWRRFMRGALKNEEVRYFTSPSQFQRPKGK